MPALMELEEAPLATGTAVGAWLHDQFNEFQTRTGNGLPARLICVGPEFGATDRIGLAEGITDPRANTRSLLCGSMKRARSFFHLASAAKQIIPNLRAVTPAEQGNLRRYYKGVYRKA